MNNNDSHQVINGKIILRSVEPVKIRGEEFLARVDTGAKKGSICKKLAEKLGIGPVIESVKVISSHGKSRRPVVEEEIEIAGKKIKGKFNLISRDHMKYPILIGRTILNGHFLVDPREKK